MDILILAEKREQGEKIAQGLSLSTKGNGRFTGQINGRNACVCWAAGHLLEAPPPDKVKPDISWHSLDSLLPVPVPERVIPSDRGKKLLSSIKEMIKESSEIWIATDPDREGEGIGWNILHHAGFKGAVKRLWLSESLEPKDIQKAAASLRSKEQSLPIWRAQQTRSTADWMWQLLVRAYTIQGRAGLMGDHLGQGSGRKSVVSVGRVQSATLKMVVERDAQIANFKPVDHFAVSIEAGGFIWPYTIIHEVSPLTGARLVDDKGKVLFISSTEAYAFAKRLKEAGTLNISAVKSRQQVRRPPIPHSLTSLQRTMSRKYGISSANTLKLADKIRLDGYLTYPRTEHGELPQSLYNAGDLKGQLAACSAIDALKKPAAFMQESHISTGCKAENMPSCYVKKPMEHHGIIPTGKAPDIAGWSRDELAVFTECATAFVTALHPPAVYDALTADGFVAVDGMAEESPSIFRRTFRALIAPGWLAMGEDQEQSDDPKDTESDDVTALPNIKGGSQLHISAAKYDAKRTKPPAQFTESSLLDAMLHAGRHASGDDAKILNNVSGIGTPATRAAVLETLLARDYLSASKAKGGAKITSTESGKDLIKYVPNDLADVVITAHWETEIKQIERADSDADAQRQRDAFIQQQRAFITAHIEGVKVAMANAPAPQAKGKAAHDTSAPPSKKQLDLVRKIGQQLGIKTDEAERSATTASAFISQWINDMKSINPPTSKMLDFAKSIAAKKGIELPEEVASSFDECRLFINQNKG